MAIGPDARRLASGRLVVVAGTLMVLGVAAAVLGAGPILEPADPVENAIGIAAVALGLLMLVAGASLALGRGPVRRLGIAGGAAAGVLGGMVTIAATQSLASCGTDGDRTIACSLVVCGTAVGGLAVTVAGVASAIVVSRARADALHRHRRRAPRR
jgi:hypothetical protein